MMLVALFFEVYKWPVANTVQHIAWSPKSFWFDVLLLLPGVITFSLSSANSSEKR